MNKRIFGWALYDLANTSFAALFLSFFFSLFLVKVLGGNEFQYGLVSGIAFILAGIFVPIAGAIVDARGRKRQTLMWFTFICIALTAVIGLTNLFWAMVLGVLAMFFYHACLDVYDAMLMDISTKKNHGRVSGYGVALGYVGTLLSLGMAFILLSIYGWDNEQAIRMMFPAIAVFFLVFGVISFLLMGETPAKKIPFNKALVKGVKEIKTTITHIYKFKRVFLFMLSSFLFTDGINIIIVFFYLFAKDSIGLGMQEFFYIFGAMAVASGIGALILGKISDKLGPKKALLITQVMWIGVIGMLYISSTFSTFLSAGIIGALALGGVWTATRPMLIQIAPKEKITEFFGFQGLTEKFSGGLGPMIFGAVVVWKGYTAALLIPLISFILAFIILRKIKV